MAYTLDPVGNRLSRISDLAGIATQSFSYNKNDHLDAEGYDANGNVVESAATNTEGGADTYDFMNRLIRRQKADGTVVDLVYNADGVRVGKRVTPAGGSTAEVAYLIDANNLTGYAQVVERLTSGGTVTAVHTFGHDLISRTTINGATAETRYYLYDGHGSVRALTDDIGLVTDKYFYDSFGNVLHESGAADNPYRYTGEFYDQDLGQYYLRARYLNTSTGRFNRVDPFEGGIQDPVSLHRYLYANANPVMFTDPSGERAVSIVILSLQNFAFGTLLRMATIAPAGYAAVRAFGRINLARVNIFYQRVSVLAASNTGTYSSLVQQSQRIYPRLKGFQNHHIIPVQLAQRLAEVGIKIPPHIANATVRLPSAYHRLVTNEILKRFPRCVDALGNVKAFQNHPANLNSVLSALEKIYTKYPLP